MQLYLCMIMSVIISFTVNLSTAASVLPHPTTVDRAVSSSISPMDISVPSSSLISSPISTDHHFNSSSGESAGSNTLLDSGMYVNVCIYIPVVCSYSFVFAGI